MGLFELFYTNLFFVDLCLAIVAEIEVLVIDLLELYQRNIGSRQKDEVRRQVRLTIGT